jgi:hypothetical protein
VKLEKRISIQESFEALFKGSQGWNSGCRAVEEEEEEEEEEKEEGGEGGGGPYKPPSLSAYCKHTHI